MKKVMKKVAIATMVFLLIVLSQGQGIKTQAFAGVKRVPDFNQLNSSLILHGDQVAYVGMGAYYTGVLTQNGTVFMFGSNGNGQLGDGTTVSTYTPVNITSQFNLDNGDKIIQLDMGFEFTLALSQNGRVFSWGANHSGQLGDSSIVRKISPVEITSQFNLLPEDKVILISAGIYSGSALTQSGKVFTWGANYRAQVGDNTTTQRPTPVDITARFDLGVGDKIVIIEMGYENSSALSQDGKVFTWGYGDSGLIGDGASLLKAVPTDITSQFGLSGGEKAQKIAMGLFHAAVITTDGKVFVWGTNSLNQLGDGTNTLRNSPMNITSGFSLPEGDVIKSIQLGYYHSSAVSEQGNVFTWGYNVNGQLGDNTFNNRSTPTNITALFGLPETDKVNAVVAGFYHTGGLTEDGLLYLWGQNNYGQLGDSDLLLVRQSPSVIEAVSIPLTLIMSFQTNGGSAVSDIVELEGTSISAPTSPTRVGYTFGGWYSDVALTQSYTFTTMPASNITIYAKWNTITYNITYTLDGGSNHQNNPASYHIETPTISLGTPTKTGYTFDGWYANAEFTGSPVTQIVLGSSGNKAFFAKWTINQYAISFDSNGGSAVSSITQDYNTAIVAPANPTRVGYTFAGWSQAIPATMPAQSITLTANWTINQYAISFNTNGGSVVTAIIQDYNTNVNIPLNPTRVGYTFAGWSQAIPATMPAESITISASWTINSYTITFDSSGGSAVSSITQDYNTALVTPANPTRLGYTFIGWSQVVPANMPAESITLTANWTINSYSITFNSNGGSAVSSITQDYNTQVAAPANPTRVGYTFAGWSQVIPATMPAESITISANWTINSYTITFDSSGGSAVSSITQDYNTAIVAPANPTRLGYTFAGWSQVVPANMPAESITLTANWTINQYSILFDTTGGSVVTAIIQDYNTNVNIPLNPTRVGYTFAGWSQAIPSTMPAESITISANWTINSYTITFDSSGGSAVSSITQDYNTVVTAPANPTRAGYTFAGWSQVVPANMPGESITLTANWTINQYAISFNTNGGSVVTAIIQDYNTNVNIPLNPTRVGYTFAGWSQAIPATMPAESITISANWTINSYTITFDSSGGSAISSITQDYNTVVTAPANPTRLGYTFIGWSQAIPATMPGESITLMANWTINSYTITFDSSGGSVVSSITQNYNTVVTTPANPTRVGYTFAGWSQAIPATMPAVSIMISASWTINSYSITFNSNGGSEVSSITQDYNSVVTAPANPTKDGYVFNGWSSVIPASMPAQNIIIQAFWLISTQDTGDVSTQTGNIHDKIDSSMTQGKDVEVTIKIEVQPQENVTPNEVSMISEVIKNTLEMRRSGSLFINIEIILKEAGLDDVLVRELIEPLAITITIPDEHRGYKNYHIIRIHNGVAEVLETSYDVEAQTLTFETDRFSTFVIAYDTSNTWLWWLLLLLLIPVAYVIYRYTQKKKEVLLSVPVQEEPVIIVSEEEKGEETKEVVQLEEVVLKNIEERPQFQAFQEVENGDYLEVTSNLEASNRVVEVLEGVLPRLIHTENSFIQLEKEEVQQFKSLDIDLVEYHKLTPGSYTEPGYFMEVDQDNQSVDNYIYTKRRLPPTSAKGHRWVQIETRKIKSE